METVTFVKNAAKGRMSTIEQATVNVTEASWLIHKHTETIRRWIYRGVLPATRVGDKGNWIIKITDLAKLMGLEPDELSRDMLDNTEE